MKKIIYQESGHGQWKKQGVNLLCLVCLLVQSLLRGGKGSIGFEKCSAADWIFLAVFLIVMISIVYIAVKMTSSEQALK